MATIKDCIGKRVKISQNSITIKAEDGKTCGVVRNIKSLYDLQPNKQIEYHHKLRKLGTGLHGKISIKDYIISDGVMYIFRNVKSKLWCDEHGYFSEEEKRKYEEQDAIYNTLREAGIEVIECIYV